MGVKKIQVLKFLLIFPLYLVAVIILTIVFCITGGLLGAVKDTKGELKALTDIWINILND